MELLKKQIRKHKRLSEVCGEILYLSIYFRNRILAKKSPETLVHKVYKDSLHKKLNLDNPCTFNEKLQWLKLYWYDERATVCCDKYRVREYIKEKNLEHILNELYGVYDDPDEINIDDLPDKFVIKPTHDSGHTIICTDKGKLNWDRIKKKLKLWLKVNYAYMSGEWPYRDIKPKIVCERYLIDDTVSDLMDYKIYCFNGEPKMILVIMDRFSSPISNFYDLEWNILNLSRGDYPPAPDRTIEKPEVLPEMIQIARTLSDGFPFVRVDLYYVNKKIIFGELTFFPSGGTKEFKPDYMNYELGDKIVLPPKNDAWKEYR